MAQHHHTLIEEIQAILAAVVGGARYGFKIRVPHAFVMTALFRRDLSSTEKIRSILKIAMEHAGNLAMFAAIYKVRWMLLFFCGPFSTKKLFLFLETCDICLTSRFYCF